MHVLEHIIFLDFEAFSIQVSAAVIFGKLKPLHLLHSCSIVPKASPGSELCFTRNCQTVGSRGSLESMLIKTETPQTDSHQYHFDVKAGLLLF